ncbi:MAG: hypothetical protein GX471_00980, partial [Candidatus Microthrix parvicella]|nr:hypothetical protein [Candidatus Microthrix parvicella]
NGLIRYEWPTLGGRFALQGSGSYLKDIWYDIQNHPISREDGYTAVVRLEATA